MQDGDMLVFGGNSLIERGAQESARKILVYTFTYRFREPGGQLTSTQSASHAVSTAPVGTHGDQAARLGTALASSGALATAVPHEQDPLGEGDGAAGGRAAGLGSPAAVGGAAAADSGSGRRGIQGLLSRLGGTAVEVSPKPQADAAGKRPRGDEDESGAPARGAAASAVATVVVKGAGAASAVPAGSASAAPAGSASVPGASGSVPASKAAGNKRARTGPASDHTGGAGAGGAHSQGQSHSLSQRNEELIDRLLGHEDKARDGAGKSSKEATGSSFAAPAPAALASSPVPAPKASLGQGSGTVGKDAKTGTGTGTGKPRGRPPKKSGSREGSSGAAGGASGSLTESQARLMASQESSEGDEDGEGAATGAGRANGSAGANGHMAVDDTTGGEADMSICGNSSGRAVVQGQGSLQPQKGSKTATGTGGTGASAGARPEGEDVDMGTQPEEPSQGAPGPSQGHKGQAAAAAAVIGSGAMPGAAPVGHGLEHGASTPLSAIPVKTERNGLGQGASQPGSGTGQADASTDGPNASVLDASTAAAHDHDQEDTKSASTGGRAAVNSSAWTMAKSSAADAGGAQGASGDGAHGQGQSNGSAKPRASRTAGADSNAKQLLSQASTGSAAAGAAEQAGGATGGAGSPAAVHVQPSVSGGQLGQSMPTTTGGTVAGVQLQTQHSSGTTGSVWPQAASQVLGSTSASQPMPHPAGSQGVRLMVNATGHAATEAYARAQDSSTFVEACRDMLTCSCTSLANQPLACRPCGRIVCRNCLFTTVQMSLRRLLPPSLVGRDPVTVADHIERIFGQSTPPPSGAASAASTGASSAPPLPLHMPISSQGSTTSSVATGSALELHCPGSTCDHALPIPAQTMEDARRTLLAVVCVQARPIQPTGGPNSSAGSTGSNTNGLFVPVPAFSPSQSPAWAKALEAVARAIVAAVAEPSSLAEQLIAMLPLPQ